MVKNACLIIGVVLLSSCTDNAPIDTPEIQKPDVIAIGSPSEISPNPEVKSYNSSLDSPQPGQLCAAAIGLIMNRNYGDITIESNELPIARVGYMRDDGTSWKYECQIEDKKMIWRPYEPHGLGSPPGRWRNMPEDEKITYIISGDTAIVTVDGKQSQI